MWGGRRTRAARELARGQAATNRPCAPADGAAGPPGRRDQDRPRQLPAAPGGPGDQLEVGEVREIRARGARAAEQAQRPELLAPEPVLEQLLFRIAPISSASAARPRPGPRAASVRATRRICHSLGVPSGSRSSKRRCSAQRSAPLSSPDAAQLHRSAHFATRVRARCTEGGRHPCPGGARPESGAAHHRCRRSDARAERAVHHSRSPSAPARGKAVPRCRSRG